MRILLPVFTEQGKVIIQSLLFVGILLILTWSCKKEDPPTLTTLPVTEITGNTAQSGGNITDNGGTSVTSRGLVWSTSENPTVDENDGKTSDGTGTGEFSSELTELNPGTTYYVRAYATNSEGTAYGDEVEFTTNGAAPTATTNDASDITSTSAVLNGLVNPNELSTTVTFEYGITTDYGNEIEAEQSPISEDTFIDVRVDITDLSPGTTYHFRVEAENEVGVTYGDNMTFTTSATLSTITTKEVIEITSNSSKSGGNIIDDGGAPVTARGVVWGTSENPTVDENDGKTSDGTGTGEFISTLTDLIHNTSYYFRAYATNKEGTAYGDQGDFQTLEDPNLPPVITLEATNITQNSVTIRGGVSSAVSGEILLRGISWGISENPTVTDNYTDEGTGTGSFVSIISGLLSNQTYYARAFASSSISGITFGNQISFTTLSGPPTVVIEFLNNSKPSETSIRANVIRDGGEDVTERGFVWGTQENPSIETNNGSSIEGSGEGSFSIYFTDLTPNTHYYIRAYATNSKGTSYSNERQFNFWDYHGSIKDIDGNTYNTVMIGGQEWITDNLKVTKYRNGIPIAMVFDDIDWENSTSGAYTVYNNNENMLATYGALYNWYVIDDERGLCPVGWRVPSNMDWTELTNYIIDNTDYTPGNVGNALKSCRQVNSPLDGDCATSEHPRWSSHETHYGTNDYGFSALPGGQRELSSRFSWLGRGGWWWTDDASYANYRWITDDNGAVQLGSGQMWFGHSVRCVRDD